VAAALSTVDPEQRKKVYLEARLGAKGILTKRVGGGATGRVYTLAALGVRESLEDLEWHASNSKGTVNSKQFSDWTRDFIEGLAAIVEFDGLETLQDTSPRSSLTLSQFNDNKAAFVQRLLREKVVPLGNRLLTAFGTEPAKVVDQYIQQYYSSEIPT
jgi:hypothetical protein